MRGQRPMTAASLSLVEPDMEISPIRLSPRSSMPESVHNARRPLEAKSLLLFGFLSQLLSQFPDFWRQECFPKGKFLGHLLCRRSFHFNQFQSLLTPLDLGQGSLAPFRLNPNFAATMSPSDSLSLSAHRLWLPGVRSPAPRPGLRQGLPSSRWLFRCALSPTTPGSWKGALGRIFPSHAGFTISDRLATPMVLFNEAEPSSRMLRLAPSLCPASARRVAPSTLWAQLHDSRPVIMINSLHLTTASRLAWRFPEKQKTNRGRGDASIK